MRPRQLRLIVSFHTTTAAIAMERYCLENGVPGRLIPIPREITPAFVIALSGPPEERASGLTAAARVEI